MAEGKKVKKAIQYGAGNIGRGFIGQLFFQSGYEVVFIDVNKEVVEKLNYDRSYPLRVVSDKGNRETLIENVRAVDGLDIESLSAEIATADIMATAVGVNVLPRIAKPIATGLKKRWSENNLQPFNIIICENLIDANLYLASLIKEELSGNEIKMLNKLVGFVEASIGRMVPVMTTEMQEGNILRVCVEEYAELPVDKVAFKGDIPDIVNMVPFSPFGYFIQRKLFIHNLGHAITAYLGYLKGYTYIWESINDPDIRLICSNAMKESAQALSLEHNVNISKIHKHVEDLLKRFENRQLGDTVERVGKDPIRKLSPNDRLVGALVLCMKKGIKAEFIPLGIAAAMCFDVKEDKSSQSMIEMINEGGTDEVLKEICHLEVSSNTGEYISGLYKKIKEDTTIGQLRTKN